MGISDALRSHEFGASKAKIDIPKITLVPEDYYGKKVSIRIYEKQPATIR
jgi:hypothetical protein